MTNVNPDKVDTVERDTLVPHEAPRSGWLARIGFSRNLPKAVVDGGLDSIQVLLPKTDTQGRPPWLLISFAILVAIPSLLCLLYFTLIASDQYIAEARFAVRTLADDGANDDVDTGIMHMQSASQDAYVVTSFIQSNELLERLRGKIDYRKVFETPQADFFARFPANAPIEDFLANWGRHVSAYIDGPSGIVTLTVRTFKPADSVELVTAILKESEKLVNEMTVRAREDLLSSFSEEVARTSKLYQDALASLNQFQQKSGLLSPELQAQEKGKLLTGLLAQKLELESRLFVLRQSSGSDTPNYKQMFLLRQGVDEQIVAMEAQITGSNDASLSSLITTYSEFETDRIVAEKLYEAARRNYDLAFAASLRKGLYLTIFVPPSLPEEALYPKRLVSPMLIFLGLVTLWATLVLGWASVEDHRL